MPALKAQNQEAAAAGTGGARACALTRLPEKRIFETLIERERLGTTGVGAGIAIPHGRMAGANTITGVFARLESAIDYEAVDSQPVDLVFMLLAPENAGADHLEGAGAGLAPAAQPGDLRKAARRQDAPKRSTRS